MLTKHLRAIQEAPVEASLMEEVAGAIEEHVQSSGRYDEDMALWIVFRLMKERTIPPHSASALMFRMDALGEHIAAGHLNEWLGSRGADGSVLVNSALFEAASKAKLKLSSRRGKPPRFDLQQFKRIVLEAAQAIGGIQ